ncbi:MAG: fibronectin type III domain-containing protein, partial [Melioribacteraceae bacterium]|nr:fibronectin type III domain-containing protein [Melioribacteraceae bacterium]
PDPFDSQKVAVEATNLLFSPKQGAKDSWEIKSGSFSEEGSSLKKDLFSIYMDIMKINKISYDHSRTNRLLINKAIAQIPILDKTIYFQDLLIDKDGLHLKIAKQSFTAFGFTFSVSDIQKKSAKSGDLMSLTAGIKFPVVNKDLSNKEYSAQVVVIDNNGKKNIKINALSNKPFQIIHGKNYLNLKSFKFAEKKDDNWVLEVEVTSDDLPLYKKLGLGPITTTFTYEKSGKMSGKLEPIKETKTGYDSNDISVIKIGKFGAIDLTYLGLKLAAVQKIATVDSKPDTTWEIDTDNSHFGIAADLHLPFAGKVLGDASGVINIGDYNKPGIKVDFNGKVSSETISVSANKKIDLGPVFLKLTKLAVTPDPFALAISGGFGVDMENVFAGEVKIEGLKIDSDGKFTNFNQVVKGGSLSILKVVKFGIDNLEYESTSSKLSFTGGDDNKSNTLQVDSYFRLKGANLSFGESGAAGGGFDELLIYEYQGNTNFILENGKLNVKDVIDLTIDLQYAKKANEECLSVGGSAKILKNYSATAYGKIGERDGDATWGFYADVGGLKISLAGPLMLDNIGAGFFYRPTKQEVGKIINLAGIKPASIDSAFSYAKPKTSNDYKCAVFLKAGFIVSDKELMEGIALTTITDSYFRIDANVKALDGKATGSAILNINWADKYAEGKFQFGVDFVVITAEEKDNYFQFYGYDEKNWGIMGKTDIKCFFIDTKSQFYVGSQGFLYDFGFGYSLDIGVLEGGLNYEIMAWWRKDVNWGVYASGKIWGEFLWGLAGGKAMVEGALISPPFTIYVAGELKLTVCYIDVFDGRVWVAMGEEGFDGGTGSNSKYDKLISDAKNIGKQMKDDMEKLAKELSKARDALYQLSEQQRIAAGKALVNLSAWSGGKGIGAFFGKAYKDWYNHDLHNRKYPYEQIQSSDFADPNLKKAFNIIWNPQAATFYAIESSLKNDSIAISNAISQIESMETSLDNLLSNQGDLISGNLPTLSKLAKLKSPVTKPSLASSTINGKQIQVFNYTLNTSEVNALNSEVKSKKKELEAYRNKLLSMVTDYVKKLNDINQLLSGGSNSVAAISQEYANTYDNISKYTRRFMDYLNARQKWGASQVVKVSNLENDINNGLTAQANKLTIPSTNFNELCKQRIDLINGLLQIGAAKNISPPKTDISAKNYKDMGKELYYHIPQKGFGAIANEMNSARQTFVKYFKTSNDIYQAKWNNFTVRCDKVYSRQTKLYTILYDLFDQLSLEAGTRKQGDASQQYLSVESGNNLVYQVDQITTVNSNGTASSNIGALYADGFGTTGYSQVGQSSFQQVTNSGIIDASTGTNISQGQVNVDKVTKKADWAKNWDFEKERKYVKQILQVPKVTQFSGNAVSDKNTYGYSLLTLNWSGTHPVGISEYSISLDGYSDPVQFDDLSSGTTGDQTVIAEFVSDGLLNDIVYDNTTYGTLFQSTNDQNDQNYSAMDIPIANQTITSPTLGNFSSVGTGLQAWRTLGNKKQIIVPFLNQVHDEGNYNIWIRARGSGGYTIERLSSINIDYCGTSTSSSDFDWSKRESSLSSTDNTPPAPPSVYDGGDTTSSLNQISASWGSFDYESGIQEYQYQVGYYVGNKFNNITDWISAGGQTEINIRLDQQMIPGTTYYIKVKAVNGAGMWSSEGLSNGIRLKDST